MLEKSLEEGSESLLLNCPASGSHEGRGFSTPMEMGFMWVTEYGSRSTVKQR